ncbi:hypothetical protein LDENG_00005610 [Lucifuga dentata]|nr:hypothetical protein LDENG_00005610 [Lucifuga dentata]
MKSVVFSRPHRAYDYLYDPVYTVSSETDHARSSVSARVRKVPEFGSMFSSLPHHPQYTLHLDTTDPLPAFIDRRWRGQMEQRKEALQQLAGVIPGVQSRFKMEESHVTGADRWKYFKRPLIPFAQQIPQSVIFALSKDKFASAENTTDKEPTHVTVGVQTDYRESETQTDPYSPDYVLQPGTTPSELLTLAALISGRGLPAGLAEVEMIERARAKRAWVATLPPFDDLSQKNKRMRMMEEMEIEEWVFRERQIHKLEESRLAVLKDRLKLRDEAQKKVTNERLNHIYSKKQRHKEEKLQEIHRDFIQSLRQIIAKRKNVEGKLERRDFVLDVAEYYSQTSASIFSKQTVKSTVIRNHYLDTYDGLVELEAGLSSSVLTPRVKTPKPRVTPPETRAMEQLNSYQALRKELEEQTMKKRPLRFLVKIEKPVPRPTTPTVKEPLEGEEERELAVIYLQKLLRGRSIQYQMFKDKERRLDLIRELRMTHALQHEEQELQRADQENAMTLQNQRDLDSHRTCQEEAYEAGVVGAELECLFDTLSKELIHLQEERRIHAFILLAEREYRLRNAAESGRRQVEERRRKEEDEIFKQVVQVHQDTVDCYLEDVILESLDQTSEQQAREEIRRMAREVNDIANAMEESQNNLQSEEIVSELVYSFLIPEVQKATVRQRVHQKQHKHVQAARQIIQGGETPSDIPAGPLVTSPSDRDSSKVPETTQQDQERKSTTEQHQDSTGLEDEEH